MTFRDSIELLKIKKKFKQIREEMKNKTLINFIHIGCKKIFEDFKIEKSNSFTKDDWISE